MSTIQAARAQATFADRILAGDILTLPRGYFKSQNNLERFAYVEKVAAQVRERLAQAHVINIQNVYDYMIAHSQHHKWSAFKDFPCLAPPYPLTWFEFVSHIEYLEGHRVGILLEAVRCESLDEFVATGGEGLGFQSYREGIDEGKLDGSQFFWFLRPTVCVESPQKTWVPYFHIVFGLNDQGEMLANRFYYDPFLLEVTTVGVDQIQAAMENPTLDAFLAMALALSFIHCNNTQVIARDPDAKVSQAWRKRNRVPLVQYHEITIEPVRRILEGEGKIHRVGLQRALHDVRGHFKHFGPRYGRGRLFGKHEGRFWIEDKKRGDESLGRVEKTYRVNAPVAQISEASGPEEGAG